MLKSQTERTVTEQIFEGMHRVARRRDIDRGGLYDSRSGAVNIWCSPDDKPGGYGYEIKKGALKYPRDYIATVVPREEDSENSNIRLEFQVDPERGGTVPLGRRTEPTEEEIKWTRGKLDDLVSMGEEERVFEDVLVCPFCGEEVEADTFNDFVKHVMNHTEVSSVEMRAEGNVVRFLDGRTLSPSNYIRKGVRK